MITVTIYTDKLNQVKRFFCSGHAGFDQYGKDIVCAAVSLLVINTANSVEKLTEDKFTVKTVEKRGEIDFEFLTEPTPEAALLIRSMVLGLQEIEKQYGKKYLNLKFEEV